MMESYKEAERYIEEIPKFTGKHTMAETGRFYDFIGSPCKNGKIIHVAGTNGKGSVCAYLRNILEEAGYHTAVFVSPHLVTVRERFLFDGEMASEEEFLRAFRKVMEKVREFGRSGFGRAEENRIPEYHPSYFEYLFFMFLMMERTARADYIILETGLGGRLDATNVMPDKAACVITQIGLDHTEYLGDTAEQIAEEKAGILRPEVPVIYASDKKASAGVIEKRAKELHSPSYPVGSSDFKITKIRDKNIAFSFHSVYYNFISLNLTTTALYQAENASLALRTVEVLDQGAHICADQIKRGISRTRWAGRMEELFEDVYVDGAHNEDGIRAFLHTVEQFDRNRPNHLIFAVVQDKRYEEMLRLIACSGLFESITITQAGGSRATDPEKLLAILKNDYGGECSYERSAEAAFDRCMINRRERERIFIAGSLYLTGQIKAHIGRNSDDQF